MKTRTSPAYEIRPATVADVRGIAAVHVATWRDAYKDIIPSEFLANLDEVSRAEQWLKTLMTGSPRVLVAVVAHTIVGWVAFGGCRDKDLGSHCAEIEAIYVALACWKYGIGTALIDAACKRLHAEAYSTVALWVLLDNAAALSFYRQREFERDGTTRTIEIGGTSLTELRLRRALTI